MVGTNSRWPAAARTSPPIDAVSCPNGSSCRHCVRNAFLERMRIASACLSYLDRCCRWMMLRPDPRLTLPLRVRKLFTSRESRIIKNLSMSHHRVVVYILKTRSALVSNGQEISIMLEVFYCLSLDSRHPEPLAMPVEASARSLLDHEALLARYRWVDYLLQPVRKD